MSVVGTLHQGSTLFTNNGRQCMSNSIAAFVHHEKRNVLTWDSNDIDTILNEGDKLHSLLFEQSVHLYPVISDFPNQFEVCDCQAEMHIEDSYSGLLTAPEDAPPYFSIETSLKRIIKFAVLIIGSSTPAFATAIIKDDNAFYIFDPHCRDKAGLVCSDGTAVRTSHYSVGSVRDYLVSLAASMGLSPCPFELTPIHLSTKTSEPVYHSLQPVMPAMSENSSDSDIPLAVIRNKRQNEALTMDTDSDDVPLVELQQKGPLRKKMRRTETFQDSSSNIGDWDSDRDPEYIPNLDDNCPSDSEDDIWAHTSRATVDTTPTKLQTALEQESNTPLKYMQVSVDAMRLIAGEPTEFHRLCYNTEQSGLRPTGNFMKDVSSGQIDLDTQNVSVPNSSDASVLDSSAVATETSFQMSPESIPPMRGRKRRRDVEKWKDTQRKKALNLGEKYISRKGKVVDRKKIKEGCGPQCRMKCHQRITMDKREMVFHLFWRTGNVDMRRLYVCHNVESKEKLVHKDGSRRKRSLNYRLELDGEKIPVCKTFFLHTLAITDQFVFTALAKKDEGGHVTPDGRGRHCKRTPAMNEERDRVRAHIRSFPTVESHYCRKDSERQYLGATLNLATMYRLYREQRETENAETIVSSTVYCELFRTEFNLGFHNPSKDRCDFCVSFENLSNQEKEQKRMEYDTHHRNKRRVHDKKAKDKEESRSNASKITLCFDLQEVLMTPHSNASVLFYKRKLNTFNLSIFDLSNNQAICNVWHEGIAGRGSNEIGSCIFYTLKAAHERGVKYISLYSDSCGGQNRNRYFLTMLWFALNTFGFQEIEHNFFIKGHSKNENDSVHSTIERVSKHVDIYTTPQWASIISTAKQSKPKYSVRELDETCFFDFKQIAGHLRNFDLDDDRQKVQWLNIKSIKLSKDNPNTVQILYDYDGQYHYLNLAQRIRKVQSFDFDEIKLNVLNNGIGPGIDKDKYDDLQSLCNSNIIPRIHHQFFNQLKIRL